LGRQAGKSIGIFQFLGSDPCRCKLSLVEAEPDVRFLLIVGTKLNLSSCCCSDRVGQFVTRHFGRVRKCRYNPKISRALVPRRVKYGIHGKAKAAQENEAT
jgi:hypothetical protein